MLKEENVLYNLNIQQKEKVVDIGCGSFPFARADVLVDYKLKDNSERDNMPIPADGRELIEANVEDLSCFKNSQFDVSIASHILEHVKDPIKACNELMRISKRGYIETPTIFFEIIYGIMFKPKVHHKWTISVRENKLIFKKNDLVNRFGMLYNRISVPDQSLFNTIALNNIDILYNRFFWKSRFEVCIDSEKK